MGGSDPIDAPAEGFFVGPGCSCGSAVESVLRDGFSVPFAATLGALARNAGRRIVYSPLLEARWQRAVHPVGDEWDPDRE